MTDATRPRPVVLAILDGWGHNDSHEHNAIHAAKTPTLDRLCADYPHGFVNASELHVGLPEGQMGNSEVGHMNIGSGRVLMQELPRIDHAIASGELASHPTLTAAAAKLVKSGGRCHVFGLMSPGGVHAHQRHIAQLAKIMAAHGVRVFVHAFTDGRDTPPQSALDYLAEFEHEISGTAGISIATVSGRYYAMDRDKRWDRVEKAYNAIAGAKGEKAPSAKAAIEQSYALGKNDEFILPTVVADYSGMADGDVIVMANFRADRARQMLSPFLRMPKAEWTPDVVPNVSVIGMSEYSRDMSEHMQVLFPPTPMTNILGEVIANAGLKQLRIAETEKYAHVTFFFNGGRENEFPGESRILIPSPKVATYDEKPEMSAPEVTEKLVEAIQSEQFDLIVVNYANTDMVGHTGDISAATRAVEAVDHCLGKVMDATLDKGGALIVTADHGNAEHMFDDTTAQPHTAHTLNIVPFIVASNTYKGNHTRLPEGKLADVAPTILDLMKLEKPAEMTGQSLIRTL